MIVAVAVLHVVMEVIEVTMMLVVTMV